MDDFRESWHHRKMMSLLDEFVNKEVQRLIIDLPPRHTKSESVSRRLPSFILGKYPDAKIISCSYGMDLASMMNRDVQNIIDSVGYGEVFPNTRLNSSNVRTGSHGSYLRNSEIFEIVGHKGVYKCAGVGGAITGFGMDYGIIDDPIKNRDEAESETYRNKIWDWYQSTFRSRKQKNACILITMTRWNEDDLVGRLLKLAEEKPRADQWEVFSLPALTDDAPIAEYDERTGPGQALWVDEFPVDDLLSTKESVTTYEWLSIYQQRPVAVSGNLVSQDQFRYCALENGILSLNPTNKYMLSQCRIFQTCDPAASENSNADYFALGTWAQTPFNDLALIDLIQVKMEKPKQLPLMTEQFNKWHPMTQWIATKGLGISLFQDLRAAGLPVAEIQEESSKVTRFISACNRIATGTVYFLNTLPLLSTYEAELLAFPNGKKGVKDDLVDITSTATAVVSRFPYNIQGSYHTTHVSASVSSGGLRI